MSNESACKLDARAQFPHAFSGEVYYLRSVSPEYFGYTLVYCSDVKPGVIRAVTLLTSSGLYTLHFRQLLWKKYPIRPNLTLHLKKMLKIVVYIEQYWCRERSSAILFCAVSRKDAGSIPDYVSGIFHRHNPSDRTMALGSTQPLTEMSTRNISWGVKAAGAFG
jgi:hypothetical protein